MDINSDGLISFTTRHPWHLERSADLIHWREIARGNPGSQTIRVFYQTEASPVSGSEAHQGFFRLAEYPLGEKHHKQKGPHHRHQDKGKHKGHEGKGHEHEHDGKGHEHKGG